MHPLHIGEGVVRSTGDAHVSTNRFAKRVAQVCLKVREVRMCSKLLDERIALGEVQRDFGLRPLVMPVRLHVLARDVAKRPVQPIQCLVDTWQRFRRLRHRHGR
jgi:hypothetical protein